MYNSSMLEEETKPAIEIQVGRLLRRHKLTIATAESCTGGLIGHLLTNVPGSSEYYLGGVVAYANEVKVQLLGVKPQTLEKYGAVSEAAVLQMAAGVRSKLGADIGVATTGIAGPGGGTAEKPVGLTWIGLSTAEGGRAQMFRWEKDRLGNKLDSAYAALQMVVNYLCNQLDAI